MTIICDILRFFGEEFLDRSLIQQRSAQNSQHFVGALVQPEVMFDDSQRYKYNDKEFDMNAWRPHELYGTPGIVRVDATTTFDPVQNLFIGKPIFVSNDIPIANYKLRKKGVFNLFYNHKGLINDGGEIWHPQSNSLTKQNPRFYIYTMIDGRYQYIPFNANSTINDYILSGPETILNEVIVKGRKKR